jgi:cytochrome c556
MSQFKRLDDELKRSATELGAAAGRRDGQGAIDAFQWLQSNCYACHREFREDFVRHFYGAS